MLFIILVRGSGDVGSAVAHTLFKADYAVVIHDLAQPSATRRKMSFCDAIFDGRAELDSVQGKLFGDISELTTRLTAHDLVPLVLPLSTVVNHPPSLSLESTYVYFAAN
jgi:xanthine dehydrogenase accessory factor